MKLSSSRGQPISGMGSFNNYVDKMGGYLGGLNIYIRDFSKFCITVACGLKFHWYLRTLSLEISEG